MLYIGLMSGTSIDAVDAVLVSLDNPSDFKLIAAHSEPIPPSLSASVRDLALPGKDGLDLYGEVDARMGELFASAAVATLKKAGAASRDVRAIGSHGQTVRHRPSGSHPFTLQIGNPSVIAERTGIATVADFRSRDIAAGGQGAPLVPAFHQWLFASSSAHRAVVNIGGIANVTHLPTNGPVTGFDIGPGNTLIDAWIRRHQDKPYDHNGRWAAEGSVNDALLARLVEDSYFKIAPPKSTGPEHFNLAWLEAILTDLGTRVPAQDTQATLTALTAHTIARAVKALDPPVSELYVCGGGIHNRTLMDRLARDLGEASIALRSTETLGLHPDWVEAAAFAWLAHQTLLGQPGNVPSVTGARRPVILGAIYPA